MRSEEVRKRISETCKLRGVGKWRKGMPPGNKGKSPSQETKDKISAKLKGQKAPWVAKSNASRTYSDATKQKRSQVAKSLWSSASFRKMHESKTRENNPAWIKDRSKVKSYNNRRDDANYVIWRKEVYERDGFKCRIANSDCKGRIEAHHILSWREHPDLRYQLNNGITLCHRHHPHFRRETAELSDYFQQLINSKS
jgi:hypothetical protein